MRVEDWVGNWRWICVCAWSSSPPSFGWIKNREHADDNRLIIRHSQAESVNTRHRIVWWNRRVALRFPYIYIYTPLWWCPSIQCLTALADFATSQARNREKLMTAHGHCPLLYAAMEMERQSEQCARLVESTNAILLLPPTSHHQSRKLDWKICSTLEMGATRDGGGVHPARLDNWESLSANVSSFSPSHSPHTVVYFQRIVATKMCIKSKWHFDCTMLRGTCRVWSESDRCDALLMSQSWANLLPTPLHIFAIQTFLMIYALKETTCSTT